MHSTDDSTDDGALIIDCDQCAMQHTDVCADCVVTFLCDAPEQAMVVDVSEVRALRLLAESGLAPPLRLARRTG
jgi:hypothetical protein